MPKIISRQQAFDKINSTLKSGECLVCHILNSGSEYILNKGKHTTTVLSEYPRTWGQTMILLNSHKTTVAEITKEEWLELTENTRKVTIALENTLKPLRCYISSLGAVDNLPNTCPHLHFNIIPIYNSKDKPVDIYTWEHGVVSAEEDEWKELVDQLRLGL